MPKVKNPRHEEDSMDYESAEGSVNVDFEAFKAEDHDFHGIRNLINQGLRGLKGIDVSGLADIIISQNYVGSVVKQVCDGTEEDIDDDSEEEELFGVSTVINLTSRKDEAPIKSLSSALLKRCRKHASKEVSEEVAHYFSQDTNHVGLLISERLVNLPPLFAVPVYDSLMEEMNTAHKNGMPYKFSFLIMICKILKLKSQSGKGKANKSKHQKSLIDNFIWCNAEEEIFAEESEGSFEYCLEGSANSFEDDDSEYIPWRRVLIIKAEKLPHILSKVKDAVS